jgi:hypothetical protein
MMGTRLIIHGKASHFNGKINSQTIALNPQAITLLCVVPPVDLSPSIQGKRLHSRPALSVLILDDFVFKFTMGSRIGSKRLISRVEEDGFGREDESFASSQPLHLSHHFGNNTRSTGLANDAAITTAVVGDNVVLRASGVRINQIYTGSPTLASDSGTHLPVGGWG